MGGKGQSRAPVSGSCVQCGCRLGFHAAKRGEEWLCCGACAGSDRCSCGCKPPLSRACPSDDFIPGRRMFGSRRAGALKTAPKGMHDLKRTFPFADPRRGR